MKWCDDCEVLHPVGDCERIQRQRAEAERVTAHHDQLTLDEAPDPQDRPRGGHLLD